MRKSSAQVLQLVCAAAQARSLEGTLPGTVSSTVWFNIVVDFVMLNDNCSGKVCVCMCGCVSVSVFV